MKITNVKQEKYLMLITDDRLKFEDYIYLKINVANLGVNKKNMT